MSSQKVGKLEGTWVLLVVGLDDEMGANTFLEKKWVFGGTSREGKSNDFGGLRFLLDYDIESNNYDMQGRIKALNILWLKITIKLFGLFRPKQCHFRPNFKVGKV